jgi:hypothetical protein
MSTDEHMADLHMNEAIELQKEATYLKSMGLEGASADYQAEADMHIAKAEALLWGKPKRRPWRKDR